jgi:hypothetical protein
VAAINGTMPSLVGVALAFSNRLVHNMLVQQSKKFAAKQVFYNSIKPVFPPSSFEVFVFGPYLRPNQKVRKPIGRPNNHEGINAHARYLRQATRKKLIAEGFSVEFGETRKMLDFWTNKFKSPDPGSSEILHARKVSGALVIFPSSVGSICELSMFAPISEIASKTLAIVHKKFENDHSFFRCAMLEVFDAENGKPTFLPYDKHEQCVAAAVLFVKKKYNKLLRDYEKMESAELVRRSYHGTALAK